MELSIEGRLSPCLEWIFAEPPQLEERFAAAAGSGFRFGEIWFWRGRDLDQVSQALRQNSIGVSAVVVDPQADVTDPATHAEWLSNVDASAAVAATLGSGILVATAGARRTDGTSDADQLSAVADALGRAAAIAGRHGVRIALEPLNDRVDHPGTFLTSSLTAGRLIDQVGSPYLGILLDVYHSHAMGEDPAEVVAALGPRIFHVQVADDPGRHEPGTGDIAWPEVLGALEAIGYQGPIGLEYKPTMPAPESAAFTARTLTKAWHEREHRQR